METLIDSQQWDKVIETVTAHPYLLKTIFSDNVSVLHAVIKTGSGGSILSRVKVFKQLVDLGADMDVRDDLEYTPVDLIKGDN